MKKKLAAALVAACVMAAVTPVTHAHQTGSIGAEKSDFALSGLLGSLYIALFGGPKGPTPPPK